MTTISLQEYRKLAKKPKRSKYGNRKVKADGYTFDSVKEHKYWCYLKLRKAAKEVWNIMVHPHYPIVIKGSLVRTVIPDFSFWDETEMRQRVVDVKGYYTHQSKQGYKMLFAEYGIKVELV